MSSNKIGLDFGTSFSTMSFVNPKTGAPEIIFVNGHPQTETIVYYGEHSLLVGKAAARKLENATEEDNDILAATFTSVKRHLLDPGWALPYDDDEDNNFVEPAGVVADFIEYMKKYAEEHCFHETIDSLRLTYPIAFKQSEKRVLEEAAKEAGFKNVEMLHEPVAAALGCAAGGMKLGDNILVYDLGAGTFDLALISRNESGFGIPLEPMGATGCAGDDFDMEIYRLLDKRLYAEHRIRFSDSEGRINKQVLLKCRKIKEDLTNEREVQFTHFLERINVNYKLKVARSEFENAIHEKVERTITLTRDMLRQAEDENIEIDTFILIGGATLTPLVKQELQKLVDEGLLPVSLTQTSNANTAVALGAVTKKVAAPTSGNSIDDDFEILQRLFEEDGDFEAWRMANTEKLPKWIKAAEQGNSKGMFLYVYSGVSIELSTELIRKAAEQGLAEAQYELGKCHCIGWGVPKDRSEAVKWYRKAAEQELVKAQYSLGFEILHTNETPYPPNSPYEAMKWFRKAAERGDQSSQFYMGLICSGGIVGVSPNYSEAVKWYRMAAAQGCKVSQEQLAKLASSVAEHDFIKQKPIADSGTIAFPDDVDDFQEAIAQCKEDGTVVISEGTHDIYEPIRINKSIRIIGKTGDPPRRHIDLQGR